MSQGTKCDFERIEGEEILRVRRNENHAETGKK